MFRKTLISLAAALSIGCSGAVVRDDISDEPPMEDARLAVTIDATNEGLPGFIDILPNSSCTIFNENGIEEPVRSFFERSKDGARAMNYVKEKINELKKLNTDSLSSLELAVKGIDLIRRDLSFTDGRGFPTSAHEANRDLHYKTEIKIPFTNIQFVHETEVIRPADSTQTLDMFLSHESGLYEGDCDDFARGLLASYEIMRDIAKANREDKFYGKLYAGLRRYKIIGMDIEGHAMNASLTFNEDFTKASVEAIEPQVYDYSSPKSNIASDRLSIISGVGLLVRAYKNREQETKFLVWRIYDSESCYCLKDILRLK